ncbi:MAG TPA: sigma-70 family RNA polymerase sigma factor [Solirubrobacter sp.]|nr:sigma-70 family RNA polymerase sigma factor [Solirubrobacter sp.]
MSEARVLTSAKRGDERAFAALLEPYRRELHAHCYRMLGSVYDADDALQDTSLRAWKALPRFEGRSSLRSWLYTIATNTCLTQIQRRPKRTLPVDYGPATDPVAGPGEPVTETVWIEPYPDSELEDGLLGPDARYEQRESVELAFIAALQLLPASQRAVLILREVLGFSAKETAEALETTVASVNSALQRARCSIEQRAPERSQQQTLRALEQAGEDLDQIVTAYMEAWERNDVDAVVALLTEDAAISMPPLASWFGPRDVFAVFLRHHPMTGRIRWRALRTTANGQPAIAYYAYDERTQAYEAFALNVLTFTGNPHQRRGRVRDQGDRRRGARALPHVGHDGHRPEAPAVDVRAFWHA